MIINGDHILIIGDTKTGKTTFAKELVKDINCTNIIWIDFIRTSNEEISNLYIQNKLVQSIIIFDNYYLSQNAKPVQLFRQNKLHTTIHIMDFGGRINFNLYDIIFFSKTLEQDTINLILNNLPASVSFDGIYNFMRGLNRYGFLYKRINKPEYLLLKDGKISHKRKFNIL
jgi:hypothetical protein